MSGASKWQRKDDVEPLIAASYVLPIASHVSQARVLGGYLRRLSRTIDEVVVVDGSEKPFSTRTRMPGAVMSGIYARRSRQRTARSRAS